MEQLLAFLTAASSWQAETGIPEPLATTPGESDG